MKHWLTVLALPVVSSCLIGESPTDYPDQPTERPTIVQSTLVPSASSVLVSFPTTGMLASVSLLNPRQTFEWRVFLDFDPLDTDGEKPVAAQGTSTPGAEDITASDPLRGLRRIEFTVAQPLPPKLPTDTRTCHTIELIVAETGQFATNNIRLIHAVDPLKSDSVTWFYSPTGDLGGCPAQAVTIPANGADAAADGAVTTERNTTIEADGAP